MSKNNKKIDLKKYAEDIVEIVNKSPSNYDAKELVEKKLEELVSLAELVIKIQ